MSNIINQVVASVEYSVQLASVARTLQIELQTSITILLGKGIWTDSKNTGTPLVIWNSVGILHIHANSPRRTSRNLCPSVNFWDTYCGLCPIACYSFACIFFKSEVYSWRFIIAAFRIVVQGTTSCDVLAIVPTNIIWGIFCNWNPVFPIFYNYPIIGSFANGCIPSASACEITSISTVSIFKTPLTFCTCLKINDTQLGIQTHTIGCMPRFMNPQRLYIKVQSRGLFFQGIHLACLGIELCPCRDG